MERLSTGIRCSIHRVAACFIQNGGGVPNALQVISVMGDCRSLSCFGHRPASRIASIMEFNWSVDVAHAGMINALRQRVMHLADSMIAIGEEKAQWLARPEVLSETLKSIVLSEAGGSIYRLAKVIGIGHMALTKWIGQSARPRFSAFIEVCYRLGKCPVQLLEDAHSTQISLFPHELLPLRKTSQ